MITGELKNRIDSLWEVFWTGGLTNPLDVIEQITYLMFIRGLDDVDNVRRRDAAMVGVPYRSMFEGEFQMGSETVDGSAFKWSTFRDYPPERMYTVVSSGVFPFIKGLHSDKESAYSRYMGDAIFKIPTPQKLAQVVDHMDEVYRMMGEDKSKDLRGDVYEYLLSRISTAGTNGQFRTPRHIIEMMVELTDPKADEVICDPSCGTAGFLVAAGDYLRKNRKEEIFYDKGRLDHFNNRMFTGYDMDRTMLRIGAMNMMSHGVENPNIDYRDSLSDQNEDCDRYTLILANPPFKGKLDAAIVSESLLQTVQTKKTEPLAISA